MADVRLKARFSAGGDDALSEELLSKVSAIADADMEQAKVCFGEGFTPGWRNAVEVEFKRFMILVMLSGHELEVAVPPGEVGPSSLVDAMWHAFIIHTNLYRDFCNDTMGRFVDHTLPDRDEVEGDDMRGHLNTYFDDVDQEIWRGDNMDRCWPAFRDED